MKFSIVTITYNRAHLIGETIQSVLNQTHADFEHIIIDDGSTDDTENVIKKFNDSRIRYYKYEKNGLRSFLRNEGIRKAVGDFISVLDSDDIWTNNKLETVNVIFNKNPDVDFVFHNIRFIPDGVMTELAFPKYKSDFSGYVLMDVLDDTILPFPVFTIRKAALDEIGFLDENMLDGQHDLYARAASKFKFYYCAEQLTHMKKHPQNISKKRDMTHYDDYLKTIDSLKRKNVISIKKHAGLKSNMHSKIAYIYHTQKEFQKAKENYLKSFQTAFFSYSGFKSFLMYLKINVMKSN